MVLPIDSSEFAEIVPTCAMAFESLHGLESLRNSSVVTSTALSIPRLTSIGLRPEATALRPSRMIAWASTVAVVVPSPASSDVLEATSFTICAPMFSNLSFSSISFATETPSFVMVGAPKLFSSTALRPFGPSVALTALARTFTPLNMRWRASSLNRTSFAAIVVILQLLGFNHGHNIFLSHHNELFPVHSDFGAAVLAEKDLVADLDVEGTDLAVLENLAFADRYDLSLNRLFGRGIGNENAARRGLFLFQTFHDDAVMKRTYLHGCRSFRS